MQRHRVNVNQGIWNIHGSSWMSLNCFSEKWHLNKFNATFIVFKCIRFRCYDVNHLHAAHGAPTNPHQKNAAMELRRSNVASPQHRVSSLSPTVKLSNKCPLFFPIILSLPSSPRRHRGVVTPPREGERERGWGRDGVRVGEEGDEVVSISQQTNGLTSCR